MASLKHFNFPLTETADEDGVLAWGGDVQPERLKVAYRMGIFPWYSGRVPVWYAPNPRFVLFPDELKIAKSLRPILNQRKFEVKFNQNFEAVLENCKTIEREGQKGTWITRPLYKSLVQLHKEKIAVSVESFQNGELVGGLFGELYGDCFFGESMFSKASNASKVAFVTLVFNLKKIGVQIIDCQVYTEYLHSFGARMISRNEFESYLDVHFEKENKTAFLEKNWQQVKAANWL